MADPAREGDRPNRHHTLVDWVALAVVATFAALHLYRGVTAGAVTDATPLRNFTVAAVALAGVALYFTRYWRPVLYLVAAVFLGALTVFWGLREPVSTALEVSRVALGVALVALFVYLFDRERTRYERRED